MNRSLTTRNCDIVRDINRACREAMMGREFPVLATRTQHYPAFSVRIIKARLRHGRLEGHVLATGKWDPIVEAYQ